MKKWVDVLQEMKKHKSWNGFTRKLGSIMSINSPAEMEAFAK